MGKVQLKIEPSLAGLVNAPDTDWFTLEKEFQDVATMADVLADVANSHLDFRRVVFDPATGTVGEGILIVLNKRLLQCMDFAGVELHDGDIIMLLPEYLGG